MAVAASGGAAFYADTSQVEGVLTSLQLVLGPALMTSWLSSDMREYMQARIDQRFSSEGDDAVGGKWAPLTEATAEIRQNEGYGAYHPINVRTGALQNFVKTSSVDAGPDMATLNMPGDGTANNELFDKLVQAQMGLNSSNVFGTARPVLGIDVKDAIYATASLYNFIHVFVNERTSLSSVGI